MKQDSTLTLSHALLFMMLMFGLLGVGSYIIYSVAYSGQIETLRTEFNDLRMMIQSHEQRPAHAMASEHFLDMKQRITSLEVEMRHLSPGYEVPRPFVKDSTLAH